MTDDAFFTLRVVGVVEVKAAISDAELDNLTDLGYEASCRLYIR